MWVRHDGSAWIENKGGLAFLSSILSFLLSFSTLSVHSKTNCLLNPAGEFLLCSRPSGASGCILDISGQIWMIWGPSCLFVCVVFICRCGTKVLTASKWVKETLELHKIALFFSQRCNRDFCGPGFSPLLRCWLEHKEHSSAVNQRTKVTDSTPN